MTLEEIKQNLKNQLDFHYYQGIYREVYIEPEDCENLLTYIKELEEENKKLRKGKNRALRFIIENAIASDKWEEISSFKFRPIGNITYKTLNKSKVEKLEKILKGE